MGKLSSLIFGKHQTAPILFTAPPPPFDPLAKVVELADFFVGIRETTQNCGPEVEMFQRVLAVAAGQPWCMAFVQWVCRRVAQRYNVQSKLYSSEHCMTVWQSTSISQRLPHPVPGCIVIWEHANLAAGHTGIVKSINGAFIETVEGNTGPGSGVVSEGDGCYERTRHIQPVIGDMKLVGFLNPF